MKFKSLFILSLAFVAAVFFSSCKKDPVNPDETKTIYQKKGVFFTNEGPFTAAGSLYFYEEEANTLHKNVFQTENNDALIGGIVQSAGFFNDKVYLVANGSGKVEVVTQKDMKSAATITGLEQPRYIVKGDGNKAYLTQWGADGASGQVKVINTDNNTVVDSIVLGGGPEQILFSDNKLYVPNSGGYGSDSMLAIINAADNTVTKQVEVGGCPTQITKSSDGTIWVLAAGCYDTNWMQKNGHIAKIEGDNATHVYEFPYGPLDNLTESPDGTMLFVTSSLGVYRFDKSTGVFDVNPVISGSVYGMDINKKNHKLYTGVANGNEKGKVYVYDLDADNQPSVSDTLDAGIFPGEFYFMGY